MAGNGRAARLSDDGLSAREVADRTAMDKVAVSRAVARLSDAGRVPRTHGDDKRRSVLRLTAKGWKIHDTVAPLARAHEREMLGLLTAEERRVLDAVLDKLRRSSEARFSFSRLREKVP